MAKRKLPAPPRPTEGTGGLWIFLGLVGMVAAFALEGPRALEPLLAPLMALAALGRAVTLAGPALGWMAAGVILWAAWAHSTEASR